MSTGWRVSGPWGPSGGHFPRNPGFWRFWPILAILGGPEGVPGPPKKGPFWGVPGGVPGTPRDPLRGPRGPGGAKNGGTWQGSSEKSPIIPSRLGELLNTQKNVHFLAPRGPPGPPPGTPLGGAQNGPSRGVPGGSPGTPGQAPGTPSGAPPGPPPGPPWRGDHGEVPGDQVRTKTKGRRASRLSSLGACP